MTTTIEHTTETIGGKEYPLTVTKQRGLQVIEFHGEMVEVEAVTIFESPLGRSLCITRARPEASPEEADAVRRRVQEIATQAMIEQGIW